MYISRHIRPSWICDGPTNACYHTRQKWDNPILIKWTLIYYVKHCVFPAIVNHCETEHRFSNSTSSSGANTCSIFQFAFFIRILGAFGNSRQFVRGHRAWQFCLRFCSYFLLIHKIPVCTNKSSVLWAQCYCRIRRMLSYNRVLVWK